MERKKSVSKSESPTTEDQKPVWKKITRGKLYPFPRKRNVRVKENEKIQASEEEIEKYRDHFELVKDGTGEFKVKSNTEPGKKVVKLAPKANLETFELVPIGEGLYNVVSFGGKKMNEEGLDLEAAEKLKEELEKETPGE
jgi:hypothetical protein